MTKKTYQQGVEDGYKEVKKIITKSSIQNKENVESSFHPTYWQARRDENSWLLREITRQFRNRKSAQRKKKVK